MEKPVRILHLEDKRFDADMVKRALDKSDLAFELKWVSDKKAFQLALLEFSPDIILSDHSLPSFTSKQALKMVRDSGMDIPVILITATMSDEVAVDSLKEGVSDYIIKDRVNRLPSSIANAMERYKNEKEKQKYHEEIERNEKLFRAMIENNAEMISLSHPEKGLIYVSPSMTATLGFTKEELFSRPGTEFIHPEDMQGVISLAAELMKKPGASFYRKHRILHKSGNYIWCEGTMTNMLHDPHVGALVSNLRDITERQLAEEELKQKERLLQQAQYIGRIGSWEVDITNNQLSWSAEMYRLMDIDPEIYAPSSELFFSKLHPDDQVEAVKRMAELFKDLQDTSYYFRFYRRGVLCHGYSEHRFEFDAEGKPTRLFGIVQDITERKEAEEKLLLNERRLKEAQHLARMGSWEIDLKTGTHSWSKEMYRIHGFEPGSVTPTEEFFISLIHPDDQQRTAQLIKSAFTTLKDDSFDFRFLLNGTTRHGYSEYKFELDKDGNPLRLHGIVQDITERKQAEEKLALEKKTSIKHQSMLLSSQINPHFIFNALNSVQYFMLLKEDLEPALNFVAEFSLLMRTALKNSKSEFIPVSEEIKFLELYLGLEQKRLQKKFTYTISIDDELDERCLFVPPMVIQPYLENAVIHGIGNGEKGSEISISFVQENEQVICTINDNGIGRQRAGELKLLTPQKKNHESVGMLITETRLKLLNQLYDYTFEVTIDDLKTQNGQARGTQVRIVLPLIDEYFVKGNN